jgi:hypothetical protein
MNLRKKNYHCGDGCTDILISINHELRKKITAVVMAALTY